MRKLVFLGLIAAVAAACNTAPTAQPTATEVAATSGAVPVATMVMPTPSADQGVVIGQVLIKASETPLVGHIMYLGDIVPLDPPPAYTITIREQASPHIPSDSAGRFGISAPPGTYALIVWTPFNSKVVGDPLDTTKELTVTVTAGQTTDLGTILVEWP